MAKASDKAMTAAEWSAWLKVMGLSGRQAADALGISNNGPVKAGKEGVGLTIALACAALAAGLEPWRPDNAREAELARDIRALIRGDRLNNNTPTAASRRKT